MTPTFVYRLIVKTPSGSDSPGWQPDNWEPYDDEAYFSWPTRRNYLSQAPAHRKAELLRSWGATVEVVRSRPVEFPEES